MDNFAICVCSCDLYSDIWSIFFYFFKKNWPGCSIPIYLNTEKKTYSDPDLNIITINCKKNCTWSERLIRCLKKIKEERVLLILDDFFILSTVNEKALEECNKRIENDKNIACFNFRRVRGKDEIESSKYPGFRKRLPNNQFWVNYLPAIWKKESLIYLLSPFEDPWQSEFFATERAKYTKWDFYESIYSHEKVIDYNINVNSGYGLVQGGWTKPTQELFAENGIDVDLSLRGFCNPQNIKRTMIIPKRTFRDKWNYFLHGGLPHGIYYCGRLRLTIKDYIHILLKRPKLLAQIIINKTTYVLGIYTGKEDERA